MSQARGCTTDPGVWGAERSRIKALGLFSAEKPRVDGDGRRGMAEGAPKRP